MVIDGDSVQKKLRPPANEMLNVEILRAVPEYQSLLEL